MFRLFLDISVALEQIHIFEISTVTELTVTEKVIERGKL